jgi:hypothetical protein
MMSGLSSMSGPRIVSFLSSMYSKPLHCDARCGVSEIDHLFCSKCHSRTTLHESTFRSSQHVSIDYDATGCSLYDAA